MKKLILSIYLTLIASQSIASIKGGGDASGSRSITGGGDASGSSTTQGGSDSSSC